VACRNAHGIVDHATAVPDALPFYLRVESRMQGTFPDLKMDSWVVPCQHCSDPHCVEACPEDAIAKDPQSGVVRIDQNACDGCNAAPGAASADKQLASPCSASCPAHMNVQGYVRLAAKGKFQDALKLMKRDNPLPAICGRVCDHPCETACSRSSVDDPVAINMIKRFIADLDLKAETRYVPDTKPRRDDKVAVIGSGPAGLSCAYFLALEGYDVTIFEKDDVPGGMLTRGIPAYRLPPDLVQAEIEVIARMGVRIKTGVELGVDVTIDALRKEGYRAFFIGIGTQECKTLGIEGEDLDGVYPVLDFLESVNSGDAPPLGRRVAVIGGGNAAFDAVRSARRTGSEDAFIVYRRSREEMPANTDELRECEEEGIVIHELTQPTRFVAEGGKVVCMECVKMQLGAPGEDGRRLPEPIPGSEFMVEVDAVITALGQEADWACLTPECTCQLTDWGTMNVDAVTFQSDDPDIFAGGDAVGGPGTVIEAIAGGKEAAISIDRFIRGVDLREGRGGELRVVENFQKEKAHPAGRVSMPVLEPQARVKGFDEVQLGLSQEAAMEEARRCLACGSACVQACPYDVIQFDPAVGVSHKCDFCIDRAYTGQLPVCADVCLTDAITFGEYEVIRNLALARGLQVVDDLSSESILYVK
jgi:NADPH-dependent glutamate synthase beta subunit-like oxidoreductase